MSVAHHPQPGGVPRELPVVTDAITPGDTVDIGRALRSLRHERGLTLVELAARCELSQPFLSQIETGRARPSMDSVFRIARALDTTPQALFHSASTSAAATTVVRRTTSAVPVIERGRESVSRLLLPGSAPFHVLEFEGLPPEFEEPWSHPGFEAVYVLAGRVELDLDGERHVLECGEFASYPSSVRHRHRSISGPGARLLLIEAPADSTRAHATSG